MVAGSRRATRERRPAWKAAGVDPSKATTSTYSAKSLAANTINRFFHPTLLLIKVPTMAQIRLLRTTMVHQVVRSLRRKVRIVQVKKQMKREMIRSGFRLPFILHHPELDK